jgi:UDP-3-O-[3-hydroxymyristoyl] glucosamine N-acyltransferase
VRLIQKNSVFANNTGWEQYMTALLGELAERVGGVVVGDRNIEIHGVSDIGDAVAGDIVFAESPKLLEQAICSQASAIISLPGARDSGRSMILVKDPRLAFAKVLELFSSVPSPEGGISEGAHVGEGTTIGLNPSIGFGACIGRNVTIGDNVQIYPLAHIGDAVCIGNNCVIHPFVCLYDHVTVGNSVIIHAGSVIGADGFGYTRTGDRQYKIPQIGAVSIGDDVEIGANTTIDRARTGVTRIGSGTKIDNLVQIAHNCVVGENSIIISLTGVSGSTKIGDRVIIAGQVGVADHVEIGDDVIVGAQAGVMGVVEPGAFLSGTPARPHKETMKLYAAQGKLLELMRHVKEMEKRMQELEARLK